MLRIAIMAPEFLALCAYKSDFLGLMVCAIDLRRLWSFLGNQLHQSAVENPLFGDGGRLGKRRRPRMSGGTLHKLTGVVQLR